MGKWLDSDGHPFDKFLGECSLTSLVVYMQIPLGLLFLRIKHSIYFITMSSTTLAMDDAIAKGL